jgi:hypothetical protein
MAEEDRERAIVGELFMRLNACTAAALDKTSIGRIVRELYAPREVHADDRETAS